MKPSANAAAGCILAPVSNNDDRSLPNIILIMNSGTWNKHGRLKVEANI